MGYYTDYTFDDNVSDEAIEFIENWDFGYGEGFLLDPCESVKWYEHDSDMKFLSSKFPNELFILYGVGEENLDLWVKYYKNGKVQVSQGEVVYEEFDETKLKE